MIEDNKIKVWDAGVRIFHWSLVALFFIAYLTGEDESLIHIYSGYGIIGLIFFRLIWGFAGTKHARFVDFLYGPFVTFRYIKSLFTAKPEYHLGHNPVGGWMVVFLLIALVGISWSGLELYALEGQGPLANKNVYIVSVASADDDEMDDDVAHEAQTLKDSMENGDEEFWEELHEYLSNFTLFLVFIHVAGVFIESAIHRENLIKAMLTGYKQKK